MRAFDCYSVLLRLGKATDSFENVSEGYLNAIRVLAAEDQLLAMQYYDDFLTYAVDRREWHAAAMAAREAANYSLRAGKPYDRHYLGVAVEAWTRAARDNQANDGPVDLSANALHAAIDAATALGDSGVVRPPLRGDGRAPPGREAAHCGIGNWPSATRRCRRRSARLAVSFPEHLRRTDVYSDIWRQDLIELELAGDPAAVLARHVADHPPSSGEHSRHALRALLLCGAPEFSAENVKAVSELALTLGQGAVYEMLSPLERLYEHPVAEVRAAVLRGLEKVFLARSFGLIRKGLADPAPPVFNEALRVLREMHFVDGVEPATRIFRESTDERVRLAALEGIGAGQYQKPLAAALVLIEAVRQETGAVRAAAEALLAKFSGDEMVTLIRQARDAEIGDRREILDRVLRSVH